MNSSEQIPPLAPPLAPVPPGFWEAHGTLVLVLCIAGLFVFSLVVWLLLRKKERPPVPPAEQARHSLDPLRDKPEDGLLLTEVSQVLRHYATDAFALGTGELTTTEIALALQSSSASTPEIADSFTGFLRECDRRKFNPDSSSEAPLNAVPRALGLIEQAELRRLELQRQAEAAREAKSSRPAPATA